MSWFPDTTTVQLMCGCFPPEKCEVKGKDITGTTHFCHVCRTTLISGLCIGNMITEAEAAGDETFSASRVKCRSCTISPYVQNKRKAKKETENSKASILTTACLMCGLGNGVVLNKDGMCRECVPNTYDDDVDSIGSDSDELDNEETISNMINLNDVNSEDSVIPKHSGQSFMIEIAGKSLTYNMMDASKFGHLNPGTRKMPGRMAYYNCDFYRGGQNDVLYHKIDTYAFRYFNGPENDLLAFCGLQICEGNDSSTSQGLPCYVLCAILVGLCGKRFLMIYNFDTKRVENWGSRLRKQLKGVVLKFRCNREIQFDFDEVFTAWLAERKTMLFDYERYKRSLPLENSKLMNRTDPDVQEVDEEETTEANSPIQIESSPTKGTVDRANKVVKSMPAPGKKITSARKSGLRQVIKQVEPFSPSKFLEEKGRRGSGSKGGSKNRKRVAADFDNVDDYPDSVDTMDTDVERGLSTETDSKSSRIRVKGKDPLAKNLGSYFQTLSSTSNSNQPSMNNTVDDIMRRLQELEHRYPNSSMLAPQAISPPLDPLQLVSGSIGMVASVVHALKDLRGALKEDNVPDSSGNSASHQPTPMTNQQPSTVSSAVNEELVRQNGILMEALLIQQNHTAKPPVTTSTSQVSPIVGAETILALQHAAQSIQQTQQQQALTGIAQPPPYLPLQTQYSPLPTNPLLSVPNMGNLGTYAQLQTPQSTQANNLLDILKLLLNRPHY